MSATERQENERGMIRRRELIKRLSRSTTITLLLSPAGLLLISAIRLVIVADYNPATALAILSSEGYVNTLLGTIMPLVPIFMPYLALVLLFFQRVILGILALLATVLISPVSIQGATAVATARKNWHAAASGHNGGHSSVLIPLLVLFVLLILIELGSEGFHRFLKTIGVIASLALVPTIWLIYPLSIHDSSSVYSDLVRQPWLPAEKITLTSHQKVVVFTLSNDGDWSEVLIASDRKVRYYPASEITARTLCQVGQTPRTRPLIPLVQAQSGVPPCTPAPEEKVVTWLPPVFTTQPSRGAGQVPVGYLFPQYASHSYGS